MTGITSKSLENAFKCLKYFLWFFLAHIYLLVFFLADVCQKYRNLTDGTRKHDHVTVSSKCDFPLNGWYRFQGAAGTKVVTTCPPERRCDTDYPVWLKGNHPTVAEGAVVRVFCIHRDGDCCKSSVNIQVKNCSSYHIYYLVNTGSCNTRYCSTD